MQQVIIDFGQREFLGLNLPLRIYGYGLMLVLGFLVGMWLARRRARRFGEAPHTVSTLGLLALIGGVVGARLAYVIENWRHFTRPGPSEGDILLAIANITSGGLIYYGGVALAMIMILWYLRRRRLPIRRYLDIIAPSLMIGLAFGRAGCLLNGCCFGGPCRQGYALSMRFPYAAKPLLKLDRKSNVLGGAAVCPVFDDQVRTGKMPPDNLPAWLLANGPVPGSAHDHRERVLKRPGNLTDDQARQALSLRSLAVKPAQIYGIGSALLLACILLCFYRLRRREGQVFVLMLVLYPITRIVLESIRGDNPHSLLTGRLTHNQWVSLAMAGAGVAGWFLLRLARADAGHFWRQRLAAARIEKPNSRRRKGR